MPKYAYFDPTVPSPSPVIGWYDADGIDYPNLPPSDHLVVMTDDAWAHRFDTLQMAVANGEVVAYTPPPPVLTPAQQAKLLLLGGLTISSTANPSLNGTYNALDQQSHIQAELISLLVNGVFADGGSSCDWPDIDGTVHTFATADQFKSFATAIAAFVAGCSKVINGSSNTLPSAAASIP